MSDLPLSDVKVLDLTRLLPGGFCSLLLADLGAEVLKVEDTGMGDYIRWAPPYYGGEEQQELGTRSSLYLALNRGKRSIRLDLKSEAGREALLRLVERYDVVLDGFRPGVLDRLGVGYERMREANPAIVFCAITGYGQDGPYTQRAGHDMNYLGLVGLLGLTGGQGRAAGPVRRPDRRPRRRRADGRLRRDGGAARAAPLRRGPDGRRLDGRRRALLAGDGRRPLLLRRRGAAPRRAAARRRPALLPPLRGGRRLGHLRRPGAEVLGRLLQRGRAPRPDREAVRGAGLRAWREVAEVFRSRTREEWRAFNDEHDCCIEPVLDLDEALDSELVRAREMVVEMEQPELGHGAPARRAGEDEPHPGDPTRPAPAFGEHTDEVLREAGYSDEEIAAMVESGAAAGPSADAATTFRA